jgi:tetratricopeptide (TPR) repeat protein
MSTQNTNNEKEFNVDGTIGETLLSLCVEIGVSPSDPLAYQEVAKYLYQKKNYKLATEISKKAIDVYPESAIPHTVLSDIFLATNEFENSKREALIAYKLAPELPESLGCYGNSLLTEGRVDEGIELLERAIAKKPNMYGMHRNLAISYARKKDYQKVLLHMKEMQRLHPSWRNWLNIIIYQGISKGIYMLLGIASLLLATSAFILKSWILLALSLAFFTLILTTGIYLKTNRE